MIPDLARWEDWSVLDRLVEMYKTGDEKSYVRQPVVTYLTVASEQPGDVGDAGQGGPGRVGAARSGRREASQEPDGLRVPGPRAQH